jgi:geranylgeranyl diphosphate synthase type II
LRPLTEYQQLVENGIKELRYPANPSQLYEPVQYMMSLGGKRIRPVLTLLAAELFGGNAEEVLKPALAMEVFHNFSLVHDDLMDNANLRRGKPTVHTQWNMPTAILSGDVMLVLAYDLLLGVPAHLLKDVLELFNQTAKHVCEGQQMDMVFETSEDVSLDQYIEMIGLKTATLLAACLKMGALLGNASYEDQELLYRFGISIGTAFQVQDDLLDSFGDSSKFGKTIGGDIVANKKTYLTLKAFELADSKQRQELQRLFSMNESEPARKVRSVLDIYNALDIKQHTEQARDSFYAEAMECLHSLKAVNKEGKKVLAAIAEDLISRQK